MRAALHVDLPGSSRKPPTEFRIFRRGVNSSVKGDFLFDDQAAQLVMAAYREHGVDVSIDFDHHTLAAASGVKAVAAGWFSLDLRDGELWACNVRWTPNAAAHLQTGEYRYFSPLFDCDPKTGRVEKLVNAGLTNTPALHDLEALVAASANHPSAGLRNERGFTMPSALPSDDLVSRAYRAATSGHPGDRRVALSAVGGPVQVKEILEQASDLSLLKVLTHDEIEIAKRAGGAHGPEALARNARTVALSALREAEREAGEAIIQEARSRAYMQGGR